MTTMSRNELLVKVAAILSTLEETNGSPESMLYIFCDMNMDKWQYLRSILLSANFIQIRGHFVTLTEDGRIKANTINQAIAQVKAS
jgi:hypothetical protein